MTEGRHTGPPDPDSAPVTRRSLLLVGGAFGLVATGAVLSGVAAADAGTAVPDRVPDTVGDFGRAPAATLGRRQAGRRSTATRSVGRAGPGVAAARPHPALGARLTPSGATIDSTPLSRRAPAWTAEG